MILPSHLCESEFIESFGASQTQKLLIEEFDHGSD